MQKGLNSDVQFRGRSFHIQTEDWGHANPFLVSRVFANGAVIKTVKTPYSEALRDGHIRESQAIITALQKQHHQIMDELLTGRIL